MPHRVLSSAGIATVDAYTVAIQDVLREAGEAKPEAGIESPLTITNIKEGVAEIQQASTPIDDPSSSEIWNFLDVVLILSDHEQCEPALVFWLVEELLDSQTIEGCRIVFDYLDSRRERMIAKHFKAKQLPILRACNELLRRLSRAEDTVFCGRVFIFLFQSFPLGDKSSVNLRGEFHVDNVTAYDELPPTHTTSSSRIDIDKNDSTPSALFEKEPKESTEVTTAEVSTIGQPSKNITTIKSDTDSEDKQLNVLAVNTLYPIFWSLQQYFSIPTKLFDSTTLKTFKEGLEATVNKFRAVQKDVEARGSPGISDEGKRGIKRKRGAIGEDIATSFNPKYLTSRDLFELEISDLAFRRHVLVQALIVIDFLLSLTPKAKSKLENIDKANKSVLYDFTLDEEESRWLIKMRSEIAMYLQEGHEGKFYYRMVDTVLSRDKNWVRWKAEACSPIRRPSVSTDELVGARDGAQKSCTNKRLRAMPLGSLDLKFLSDGENGESLEKFKDPKRYTLPPLESFKGPLADDEFDVQTARTEADKQLASNARASKLWRTLRIASKGKFGLFDRIDDGSNLQALFEITKEGDASGKAEEKAKENDAMEGANPDILPTLEDPSDGNPAVSVVVESAVA